MESVTLFTETRNEYLKQLSSWIVPPLVEFFRKEYNSLSAKEGKRTMVAFQNFCAEVPRWNQDVIDSNIGIILDNCRCDYVEELMTAVFIAHTKMLTAIRVNTKKKNLQITLPKLDHFLHRVFVECARGFWKAPFLFAEELMPIEKQKNVLQAEAMCTEALSGAVRSLLPVKNILRDYLDEGGDSESEEEEPVKKGKKGGAVKEEEDIPAPVDIEEESVTPASEPVSVPAAFPTPAPVPASAPAPAPAPALAPAPEPAPAPVIAPEPAAATLPEQVTLPTANSPKPDSEPPKAPEPIALPISSAPVTIIEKLDTPPQPVLPTISSHSASGDIPASSVVLEKVAAEPSQNVMIDTEPVVHFTPYDTVYDENTANVSEIRYAPKVSVEDKPPSTWGMDMGGDDDEEDIPKLTISNAAESLAGDFIEDLEAPARPRTPEDVDVPLGATSEFEELT
jgi:hypothetical protein